MTATTDTPPRDPSIGPSRGLSLDGVVASSEPADYRKTGFHHRHVAEPAALPAVAERFRAAGYILEMITCEDRRTDLGGLRLIYTFNRLAAVDRHWVVATVAAPGEAPTVCPVYRAADWMEREVFDMYGVTFAGHPALERILLPEDVTFHALLKDFGRMDEASGQASGGAADEEEGE